VHMTVGIIAIAVACW